MPLFSIITVCLNDKLNLLKTSDSVVKQDFIDREYIVWDGGSSDGTQDLLSQIGADRYTSEKDNGIFDAMNKALKLCNGEYINFLNAGDTFYSKEILSTVAQFILNNPEIKFFYGDVFYPASSRPYSLQPKQLTPFTLFRGTVCHQAWFLKADVYQTLNGFDKFLKFKGDYDVLLRVIHQLHLPYMHLPFCIANYKGGGYSEKVSSESEMEFEEVRRKYISSFQAFCFSFILSFLNPLRNNIQYKKIMALINHSRAKKTW